MGLLINYLSKGLRIISKRAHLPTFIILFVTSRCNSRCQHCFFWKDLNAHKDELTLDEIKKLSLDLKKVPNLAISGGEPFLREDLPEICELFYNNNKVEKIHLPTNGLATNSIKKILEEVLKKCPCGINVALSLDGLEETHDKLRGVKGNFKSVLKTYNEIVGLKQEYPNLTIVINTVVSNKNHKEFVLLSNKIREEMPEIDGHGYDWIRGSPKDSDIKLPTNEEIKELLPHIDRTTKYYASKQGTFKARLEYAIRKYVSKLKYDTIRTNKQLIPCRAGDIFAVVYPKGEVAICELLPTIGNLREKSIKKIWNSEEAEAQRKNIAAKKCYCTHGCFQPTNVIFYPRAYPKIIKNLIRN